MRSINNIKGLCLFIFFILSFNLIFAEQELALEDKARLCLDNSEITLNELKDNNFNYQRVEDLLIKAKSIYDAQIILFENGKSVDFSLVFPYCEEIANIRNFAFDVEDKYSSLKKFYEASITPDMNSSSIEKLFLEIEEEIDSERYERVPELINKAYEEISVVKSSNTKLNLFYKSTTRSFKRFIEKNWIIILVSTLLILLFFLIFNKKIKIFIIERNIKNLELRRKTIQDLMKETQLDYFQKGVISQGNFNLRTKKFAEFVRDIDRQIPLLREDLIKLRNPHKR